MAGKMVARYCITLLCHCNKYTLCENISWLHADVNFYGFTLFQPHERWQPIQYHTHTANNCIPIISNTAHQTCP